MIIEEICTSKIIQDQSDNIGRKLMLADEIISVYMPLFSEEIDRKKRLLEDAKRDHQHLKNNIGESKNTLKEISNSLRRERSIREILIEINKMITSDVLYGNNKQFVSELLTKIESLDVDDLQLELSQLRRMTTAKNVRK
jgi:hypothetical protein